MSPIKTPRRPPFNTQSVPHLTNTQNNNLRQAFSMSPINTHADVPHLTNTHKEYLKSSLQWMSPIKTHRCPPFNTQSVPHVTNTQNNVLRQAFSGCPPLKHTDVPLLIHMVSPI